MIKHEVLFEGKRVFVALVSDKGEILETISGLVTLETIIDYAGMQIDPPGCSTLIKEAKTKKRIVLDNIDEDIHVQS